MSGPSPGKSLLAQCLYKHSCLAGIIGQREKLPDCLLQILSHEFLEFSLHDRRIGSEVQDGITKKSWRYGIGEAGAGRSNGWWLGNKKSSESVTMKAISEKRVWARS